MPHWDYRAFKYVLKWNERWTRKEKKAMKKMKTTRSDLCKWKLVQIRMSKISLHNSKRTHTHMLYRYIVAFFFCRRLRFAFCMFVTHVALSIALLSINQKGHIANADTDTIQSQINSSTPHKHSQIVHQIKKKKHETVGNWFEKKRDEKKRT